MRLPGFAAESSLHEQTVTYPSEKIRPSSAGTVLPQFFRCWGNYCCNEFGYCIYKGHVMM
jgi:hypothetical protein